MRDSCQRDGCEKQPDIMCKVLMTVEGMDREEKIVLCWGCYNEQISREGQGR